MVIYRVEEWRTVGGDLAKCVDVYHFDTEHEAKVFKKAMESVEGNILSDWYLQPYPLYTHMQDALTAAKKKG